MTDVDVNTPDTFGDAAHDGSTAMTTLSVLELAPEAQTARPRPAVKRLFEGDRANIIAFTFTAGQDLPDHRAAHPITVQCLSGSLDFACGEKTVRMTPGVVLHLKEMVTHRVECPTDTTGPSVLLLTMLTG